MPDVQEEWKYDPQWGENQSTEANLKKKKNVASVKNMHKNLMSSYMFMLYIQKITTVHVK